MVIVERIGNSTTAAAKVGQGLYSLMTCLLMLGVLLMIALLIASSRSHYVNDAWSPLFIFILGWLNSTVISGLASLAFVLCVLT